MFFYVLFGKLALDKGEIWYATWCIVAFCSIEISIRALLNTIKKEKLERKLDEIKKQKFKTI